jgi:hypothetical protein
MFEKRVKSAKIKVRSAVKPIALGMMNFANLETPVNELGVHLWSPFYRCAGPNSITCATVKKKKKKPTPRPAAPAPGCGGEVSIGHPMASGTQRRRTALELHFPVCQAGRGAAGRAQARSQKQKRKQKSLAGVPARTLAHTRARAHTEQHRRPPGASQRTASRGPTGLSPHSSQRAEPATPRAPRPAAPQPPRVPAALPDRWR